MVYKFLWKFLWANDCERRESFSKYVKNADIWPFPRQISIYGLDVYFSMRYMTWPMLSWENKLISNRICCKRQVQSRFDVFLSPFVAHKGDVCFCLHNVRCTSPTVNLFNGRIPWIFDPRSTHMITTASKSETAKSFVDSCNCLLCTTPNYYVWSSWFDGLNPCLQRFLVRHANLSSHFRG